MQLWELFSDKNSRKTRIKESSDSSQKPVASLSNALLHEGISRGKTSPIRMGEILNPEDKSGR